VRRRAWRLRPAGRSRPPPEPSSLGALRRTEAVGRRALTLRLRAGHRRRRRSLGGFAPGLRGAPRGGAEWPRTEQAAGLRPGAGFAPHLAHAGRARRTRAPRRRLRGRARGFRAAAQERQGLWRGRLRVTGAPQDRPGPRAPAATRAGRRGGELSLHRRPGLRATRERRAHARRCGRLPNAGDVLEARSRPEARSQAAGRTGGAAARPRASSRPSRRLRAEGQAAPPQVAAPLLRSAAPSPRATWLQTDASRRELPRASLPRPTRRPRRRRAFPRAARARRRRGCPGRLRSRSGPRARRGGPARSPGAASRPPRSPRP
jgi:hypothetical protein